MSDIEPAAEPLRNAYELAFFIHAEKATALRIATDAMANLEVAATAQAKRLYYRPAGRAAGRTEKSAGFRTKVSLEELILLQRLVFIESESFERETEGAPMDSSLTQDDLLVRFVKHLAQITIRRSTFYVTIGTARILHNYSTSETMRIHDSLLREPERMKDADYFRARKATLMQEIRSRFGAFLTVSRTARGEERFESRPPSQKSAELVEESLKRFTPWNTPCLSSRALSDAMPKARDDENRIEVNRMHAILHPNCFRQMAAALNLDPPDRRLEIPTFSLAGREKDEDGPPAGRSHPPELTLDDVAAVGQHLAEETARRRRTSAGLLRVLVDGTERARLDRGAASSVRVELESGAELIEVRTSEPEGGVLLAVHLLQDDSQAFRTAVVLEERQKISFSVAPGEMGPVVEIAYREARLARALSTLQRLFSGERRFPGLKPVLGLAVLILAVAGIGLFVASRRRQPEISPIASRQHATPQAPIQVSPSSAEVQASAREPEVTAAPTPRPREKQRRAPAKQPEERFARMPSRESTGPAQTERDTEGEETRAVRAAPAAVTLRDLKTVYIDVLGDEPAARRLRDVMIRELRITRRLKVAETPDQADAVLKASWDTIRGAVAQLVNARGQVIWPAGRKQRIETSPSSPEESAVALISNLLKDLASSGQKK